MTKHHVFSSGVGNDPLDAWRGREVNYWCVRGPLSAQLLSLPPETALTDGAILTPLASVFPANAAPGPAIVVIPHFQTLEHPGWDAVAAQTGFEVLDPRADPVSVITRIAGARLVLTESLHGAILADTYGIPWSVFATSGNFGTTKFVDWCLSLGMDFNVTYVPPPSASHILQHGKGPCVWGQTAAPSIEDAVAAFQRRVGPPGPPTLRGRLKSQITQRAFVKHFLPYSPARTAAALSRLANSPAHLSRETTRKRLQDRMMAHLAELTLHHRALV
jgi:succinoglycan biosynthesis protein ExoV